MNCDFETSRREDGKYLHTCQRCNEAIVSRYQRLVATCGRGPGSWLTWLLAYIGIESTPECNCASHANEMDNNGAAWCSANIATTLEVMRAEAEERATEFFESQARWLVELAIKLAAAQRKPNRLERIRLRAMRLGNRLLNGQRN